MRMLFRLLFVCAVYAAITSAAFARTVGIAQASRKICLATPSDTASLNKAVAAGDDLVLLVAGQGYRASARWSPASAIRSMASGPMSKTMKRSVRMGPTI